jgi:voltage-gated potassium channel Kch
VTLGLQLSFTFGTIPLATMLFIFAAIFLIKPLILFLITMFAGYGSKISVQVGLGLAQVSEFGFILAGIGLVTPGFDGTPVLSGEIFSFLITVIAVSMIITPYITTSSSRIAKWFYETAEKLPKSMRKKYFTRKIDELEKLPSKRKLNDHIIIIGGGTVGGGLAKALHTSNQVVVIDHDPEVVEVGMKDGLHYGYGSPDNPMLWDKIDLKDAKLLIISIPKHKDALEMIKEARNINKKIAVFATARYFHETLDFYRAGVDFVSMPYVIGSNLFLENITKFLQTGKIHYIQNFKTEYLRYLEDKVDEERRYKPQFLRES